jgi:hypothetical protein
MELQSPRKCNHDRNHNSGTAEEEKREKREKREV